MLAPGLEVRSTVVGENMAAKATRAVVAGTSVRSYSLSEGRGERGNPAAHLTLPLFSPGTKESPVMAPNSGNSLG